MRGVSRSFFVSVVLLPSLTPNRTFFTAPEVEGLSTLFAVEYGAIVHRAAATPPELSLGVHVQR